ncbi:MAG TPA: Ig-like domain-containing protein [Anaeromyxobacter sp.]|nr:Ig-like domain-containing protein [Anaeromyxobacter sp.]
MTSSHPFRRILSLAVPLALLAGAGDAAAVTAGGVTADVVAVQSWQGGFNGAVRVANNSFPSAITSFQVVFKMNGTAGIQGNGWNGTISSPDASGNRTARNAAWMGSLATGRTWDEGFSGTGTFSGATIVSLTVNGQSIPLGGTGGDTTAPTVSLASSATSVTSAATITLTASATDNVGVARVEFYDGATLLGADLTAPYTWQVALSSANNGTHAYTARASDAAGNTATSAAVTVTVNVPTGGDTTAPTVSLASSATSVTTARTITLTATATDNVGVTRVEFYDGATLLASDTTSPYSTTVSLTSASNGTKSYTARAYDAAGNNRTSAAVAVTVNIPVADTTPPTVSLTSSATSVTAATTLTLSATASDNVGVTRVEFRDGTTLLATDTSAPYGTTVSLTSASNGTRSYTARAYDAAGNSATSTAVAVTVNISGGDPGTTPVYTAAGGKFLKDGVELELFGLNWFGMETPDRVLHGLWTGRQLDDFLADFKSKGFNALRLPLSPQVIRPGYLISSGPYSGNDCAAMCGKDGRTGLEYVLQRMQAAGMYALLDFHTCNPAQLGSGLPGSPVNCSGYSLSAWISDLETLAQLSKTYPNVIGVDLTNEPHQLTWAAWADYSSLGGQAVLAVNPNTTVWVEGVGNASTAGVPGGANWGQNLYEAGAIPNIPNSKLVYTPHSYGPSVAAMSYFSDPTFPANMPALWDTMFGHLIGKGYTVVVGEYGGQYTGTDKTWQDAFVSYLINRNITSSFYWCVNPNSGDTGGVLQGDWRTWNNDKVLLLQRLMR